jgi:hypothetical protein
MQNKRQNYCLCYPNLSFLQIKQAGKFSKWMVTWKTKTQMTEYYKNFLEEVLAYVAST